MPSLVFCLLLVHALASLAICRYGGTDTERLDTRAHCLDPRTRRLYSSKSSLLLYRRLHPLKQALINNNMNLNVRDRRNQTCLHAACSHGNSFAVHTLLRGGAVRDLSLTCKAIAHLHCSGYQSSGHQRVDTSLHRCLSRQTRLFTDAGQMGFEIRRS